MLENLASIVAVAGLAILPFALLDLVARLVGGDQGDTTVADDRS